MSMQVEEKECVLHENNYKLWTRLRAEVILHFHQTNNPNINYDFGMALKVAKHELESDLEIGELRITIEDLLLRSESECVTIIQSHMKKRFAKAIEMLQNMNFNLSTYHHAIEWWRGNSYGKGSFNKELYERFLQVRFSKEQ